MGCSKSSKKQSNRKIIVDNSPSSGGRDIWHVDINNCHQRLFSTGSQYSLLESRSCGIDPPLFELNIKGNSSYLIVLSLFIVIINIL